MQKFIFSFLVLFSGMALAQSPATTFTETNFIHWKSGSTKYGEARPENGRVELTNTSEFMYWYDTPYNFYLDSLAYFEIEFAMTKTPGNYGNGLYFHVGNYAYEYWISPDGYYKVRTFDSNDKQDSLMDWRKSAVIKTAKNARNTLGVECRNGIISVYINGTFMDKMCNGKLLKNNPKVYTSATPYFRQRSSLFRISLSVNPNAVMEVTKFSASEKPKTRSIHLIANPNQGYKKENLGPAINTSCEELNPVVSADDRQLYFSIRECAVANTNSRKDDDLFYSTKDSLSPWKKFQKLGPPFNNKESSSMISISGDNNTIYFKGTFSGKKEKAWFTHRLSEGRWGPAEPFHVEEYKELNRYSGRTISANRKIMISYLEEANSIGNTDLYVSFSEDGINFSRPKNLGSMINTPLSEFGVFIAPDNKTLYFSSYGHAGYGGSDIFVTRRLDDTWTKWSRPENLGPEINTKEWDAYFTIIASGKYAYMVSVQGGTGGSSDIVRIPLPQDAQPDPVVLVRGRVLDAKTKKPLFADVVSTLLKTNTKALVGHSDSANGAYQIILPAGELYDFLATKENYYPNSQKLDLTGINEYKEFVKDIYLTHIDSAAAPLNNISFVNCSDTFTVESYAELDRLAAYMHNNKGYDSDIDLVMQKSGECPHEDVLADKRAAAIKKYLVQKGIDEKRIKHKGHAKPKEEIHVAKTDSIPPKQIELNKEKTEETEKIFGTPQPDTPQKMAIHIRFVKNKSHHTYHIRKQL